MYVSVKQKYITISIDNKNGYKNEKKKHAL